MKNLTYASSVTIALLAGCGGSQMPQSYVGTPMGLHQQMSPLRQPMDGGEFTGSYRGYIAPDPGCHHNHREHSLDVQGRGHASFLGESDEVGSVDVKGCDPVSGSFWLENRGNPKDRISLSVRFSPDWSGTFVVDGGTGKFAKATGSGSYSGYFSYWETGVYNFYDDQFTGKLNF
jgi:hypothetical protein